MAARKSCRCGDFHSRRYPSYPSKGRYGKRLTHRYERLEAKRAIRRELADLTRSPEES